MVNLKIDLPENFLEPEERCGYQVSSEMKQVWAVELDLLAELMRVCDKNKLRYYADGGTMLGVVRHQGFIPWDNDIDIAMPRKDYDKLCEIAINEFSEPYFFQTVYSDPHYFRMHAQLRNSNTTGILYTELNKKYKFNQGIFIDIFPFDNLPDDSSERSLFIDKLFVKQKRVEFLTKNSSKFHPEKGITAYKWLKGHLKHFIAASVYACRINFIILCRNYDNCKRKYLNEDTEHFANLSLLYYTINHKNYFKREWYEKTELAPFEMLSIPVPSGKIEYLDTLYGDWKTFKVSGSQHGDTFFDTDKPYTEYLK